MRPQRCCFLPQDFACLLVGLMTFVISLAMMVLSTLELIELHKEEGFGAKRLSKLLDMSLTNESLKIICGVIIVVAVLWMLCSVMLIVGIVKIRPYFLLCYFGYGSVVVIIFLLSALLVLLTKEVHWIMAVVDTVTAIFYIYCLISIHALYEEMQQGIYYRPNQDQLDEELIQEFNDRI